MSDVQHVRSCPVSLEILLRLEIAGNGRLVLAEPAGRAGRQVSMWPAAAGLIAASATSRCDDLLQWRQ